MKTGSENGVQLPTGFEIRWHEPTQQHWMYVDAGRDPKDGMPLTLARPASPTELLLWEQGKFESLAEILQEQGVNVKTKKPSKWRRFLRRFF